MVSSTHSEIRAGTEIDYALRMRGIPLRWRSKIAVWDPPRRFVDEQLRGPYRRWRHLHEFEADGRETIARDDVEYSILGGRLVNHFVRQDLERIFDYREQRLRALLSGTYSVRSWKQ